MSDSAHSPPFFSQDERYRVLAESAPDAIVTIDENGIILSLNPATEQIFGWLESELLGRNITDLMPSGMRAAHSAGMARYLRSGQRHVNWQGVQVSGLTRDGREFPIEVSFGEFVDGGRRIFSGFMRDVSERDAQRAVVERTSIELQEALVALELRMNEAEAARHAADEANATKAQFLRTMSHELLTPLNAIGGFVALLEMGVRGPLSDAQRDDLGRIRAAQTRLLTLISDVLSFARLDEGRIPFTLRPVLVAPLLRAVGSMLEAELHARQITFRCAPGRDDTLVTADEQKLRHVLLNLMSNAAKFTPPGGTITLTCAVRDDRVQITVRDDGPGIPADRLEAVFEPFVQADSALTRAHEGSGLGLSISRELARGMNGELTLESIVGTGAAFMLSLPVALVSSPPRPA